MLLRRDCAAISKLYRELQCFDACFQQVAIGQQNQSAIEGLLCRLKADIRPDTGRFAGGNDKRWQIFSHYPKNLS
jgi:hypothetical protein